MKIKTKALAAALAALVAVASFCACDDGTGAASGGNLKEMKTVEEVLAETPAGELVGKNGYHAVHSALLQYANSVQ